MNIQILLITIFIGLAFVGWPTAAKFLGFHGSWANVVVTLGTGITALIFSRHYIVSNKIPAPHMTPVLILFLVAVVNGFAVSFYARSVADPEIPTATFIVMVSVFMVVWAPILDYILNGSAPHIRQIIGYVCAIAAIYFLTKQ
jgi:drug/metabolite transporter (DMT)-like permease